MIVRIAGLKLEGLYDWMTVYCNACMIVMTVRLELERQNGRVLSPEGLTRRSACGLANFGVRGVNFGLHFEGAFGAENAQEVPFEAGF